MSGWRPTASAAPWRFRGRHQVRVDVVVGDRAVLVRSGDAVDPERPGCVVVAERAPQPRCLDQQLDPGVALELLVLGGRRVADDGGGDRRVDVERGCPRGPVARALLAVDRPPREGRAAQPQRPRPLARELERVVPPAECVGDRARAGVGEDRQHEPLRVPERVAVVPGAGQPLCGDRPLLSARTRLDRVEQREPERLLELRVTVELDVGLVPEPVKVGALLLEQAVPSGVLCARHRRRDLVVDGRHGPLPGPAVGQELDDPHRFAWLQGGRDRQPREVLIAVDRRLEVAGTVDHVVHRDPDDELARLGGMHEQRLHPARRVELADERGGECRRRARIARHRGGRLVGDQLGLHHHRQTAVERLDLVGDRGDGSLHERHEPGRADPDAALGRRDPLRGPPQHAGAQVEHALVACGAARSGCRTARPPRADG